MPLIRDIRNDVTNARQVRLPWWGVLWWMVGCGLIVWPLVVLGRFDLALPVLNSIAILGFAIGLKRNLWSFVWFWITMTLLAVLHLPLILLVPWTTQWVPAMLIGAVDSVVLIAMLATLAVVENFAVGRKPLRHDGA